MPSTPQPRRWQGVAGLLAAFALAVVACSPAAQATPTVTLPGEGIDLSAGTYALGSFPVNVTFEVPTGWISCSASNVEQAVCHKPLEEAAPIGVSFLIVDNVVADPCSELALQPPVGPSVDNLVTAITNLQGFEATAPVGVTVDGFEGREFTITAPAEASCDLKTWATANRTNGVGAGEVNVIRIVDVAGTRVLISGAYHPQDPAPAERLAALQQVMDSVRLQP